MEPALHSGDRGKHLHSKFQKVHERMNYLPDLKFGLLASPRGLRFESGLIQSRAKSAVPELHQGSIGSLETVPRGLHLHGLFGLRPLAACQWLKHRSFSQGISLGALFIWLFISTFIQHQNVCFS